MSKTKNAPKAPKVRPTYWHGGAAGRSVHDSILPASQVPEMRLLYSTVPQGMLGTFQQDFVYITTNEGLAFNYAQRYAQATGEPGALYRVAPSREPLHDVDYPVGISFRCRAAVVLDVVGGPIAGNAPLSVQGLQANTWQDGTQVYDPQGYPLPNKVQKKFGVTPADLRGLGIGAAMPDILSHASRVVQRKNPGITQDQINAADPALALLDARGNRKRAETASELLARLRHP